MSEFEFPFDGMGDGREWQEADSVTEAIQVMTHQGRTLIMGDLAAEEWIRMEGDHTVNLGDMY